MTLQGILSKLKAINPIGIAVSVLMQTEEEIITYMKDQLYAGQDGQGNILSPTYLTDPFFKTRKAAETYAKWKAGMRQRIPAPYLSPKPYDVPNLIITGQLVYDRLALTVSGDRFAIAPIEPATRSMLEEKYGAVFKLNPYVMAEYKRQVFNRVYIAEFKKALQ